MSTIKNKLFLGSPYLIQFNLLTQCPNHCDYCYLKQLGSKRLSLSDVEKFLNKFKEISQKYKLKLNINLLGGDLWLHPEIDKIIKFLFEQENVKGISICVNNLWSSEGKSLILKYKDKINVVQLNIDSLEGRQDDIIFLEKHIIPAGVKIMLSKYHNIKRRIRIAKRFIKLNPDLKIFITRLCPQNKEELRHVMEFGDLLDITSELKNNFKNFSTEDPLVKTLIGKSYNISEDCIQGCLIPNGGLTVFPDKTIKICARIPSFKTGFTINNFDFIKYLKAFSYISRIRKQCDRCKFFESCQGGCLATSYIKYNGFDRDIHCLIKNEYRKTPQ